MVKNSRQFLFPPPQGTKDRLPGNKICSDWWAALPQMSFRPANSPRLSCHTVYFTRGSKMLHRTSFLPDMVSFYCAILNETCTHTVAPTTSVLGSDVPWLKYWEKPMVLTEGSTWLCSYVVQRKSSHGQKQQQPLFTLSPFHGNGH